MTIGLSFEEYVELKLKPRAGADPVFFQAAEQERDNMFPMPRVSVASHLRSRGYDCRPESLDLLLESGVVSPADSDAGTQADVDTAAAHFEDCGVLTPYAAMCETLGCRYADFVRALREAAERESKAYSRNLPADDQYFVMHRTPPRGVAGPDGDLIDIRPAVISFTLADDIRVKRGQPPIIFIANVFGDTAYLDKFVNFCRSERCCCRSQRCHPPCRLLIGDVAIVWLCRLRWLKAL